MGNVPWQGSVGARWSVASLLVAVVMAVPGWSAALPPVAGAVEVEATAGTPATWQPAVADPDSTRLSCSIPRNQEIEGEATVETDCSSGTYKAPADSDPGEVTFTYRVTDGDESGDATVTATVTAAVVALPEPEVAAATITRYRWLGPLPWNWSGWHQTVGGPIETKTEIEEDASVPNPLGFLSAGDGEGLKVTGERTADGDALALSFHTLDGTWDDVGTWTGDVDLIADAAEKKGKVTLTVNYQHGWIWALLALVVGAVLAYAAQRWVAVPRKLNGLRTQAAALGGDLLAAKEAFENAVAHHCDHHPCWQAQAYGVERAIDDWCERVAASVRELLSGLWFWVTEEAPAFTRLEEALVEGARVRQLLGPPRSKGAAVYETEDDPESYLSAHLVGLDKALQGVAAAHGAPPHGALPEDEKQRRPRFFDAACEQLTGSELKTFEKVEKLHADVVKSKKLALRWLGVRDALCAYRKLFKELDTKNLAPDDRSKLTKAEGVVAGAIWDLWRAKDADDLAARLTDAEVLEAEALVGQLSHYLGDPCDPAAPIDPHLRTLMAVPSDQVLLLWSDLDLRPQLALPLPQLRSVPGLRPQLALPFLGPRPVAEEMEPASAVEHLRSRRRRLDMTVLGLALAFAIWAGMKEIYLDPATFGTVGDYAGAFAWGFGSVTALQGLTSLFGKIGPVQLPTAEKKA